MKPKNIVWLITVAKAEVAETPKKRDPCSNCYECTGEVYAASENASFEIYTEGASITTAIPVTQQQKPPTSTTTP